MKIIRVEDVTKYGFDDRENDMDLMNVLMDYGDGITGNSYMYRAHYNRIVYQDALIKQHNIPQGEIDILEDLFRADFASDHFYNMD